MVKITNVFGDRYSGQAGKAGVFATWKGRQYRRAYVIPANPKTTKQTEVRTNLANAITRWHLYQTIQRKAYAYMAAGQVMSGFNLFVSRWQKAMPASDTAMIDPPCGIKQCGHTKTARNEVNVVPAAHVFTLGYSPGVIGSLLYTLGGTDPAQDAYTEINQGFIRIPTAIATADGAKGIGNALVAGDQLCVSYEAGGRVITREVLYTIPTAQSTIPAKTTMAVALQTEYWPIDFGTVNIETHDLDGAASEWTQLESLEIDPVIGKIYYNLTDPVSALGQVDYDSFSGYEDVKIEITKADTSFIAYREYSDDDGHIPLSLTVEDETFDSVFTLTGQTPEIRAAQTAALAAVTEFIEFTAP